MGVDVVLLADGQRRHQHAHERHGGMMVKVTRMAVMRPIIGTNAPQITGATYAMAVPATRSEGDGGGDW